MLLVHVIVTCLPVGPVLEGCLVYFALCQSNIHPHGCSDEPRIDNNLLSARDLTRIPFSEYTSALSRAFLKSKATGLHGTGLINLFDLRQCSERSGKRTRKFPEKTTKRKNHELAGTNYTTSPKTT